MPIIPNDLGLQTPRASRGIANIRAPDYSGAQAALGNQARATQNLGRAAESVGMAIERDIEREDKAALVDAQDHLNNFQRDMMGLNYGRDGAPGLFQMKGKNAIDLEKTYTERSNALVDNYAGQIKNPVAQQAFIRDARKTQLGYLDRIKGQEVAERQAYQVDVTNQSLAVNTEKLVTDWGDKQTMDNALKAAGDGARISGALAGASPEMIAENSRIARSGVYRARLFGMVGSENPQTILQAQKEYESLRESGQLALKDTSDLDKLFGSGVPRAQAADAFQKYRSGNRLEVAQTDDVFNAMLGVESNNRHFNRDGTIVTSGKGARGIAQLMPATAKEWAAKLGLPEDAINDPEMNRQIGQAYFEHLQTRYGDNHLAVAAYNMGYGALDRHIKKVGDPRKGEISMDQFVASLPSRETREYVAKVGAGLGQPTTDAVSAERFGAVLDPEARAEYDNMVKTQIAAEQGQVRMARQSALDTAFAFITQNKAGWEQMPSTMRMQMADAGIAKDVQDYKGVTTPAMADYLYSLSAEKLKQEDLNTPAIRFNLSPEDYARWTAKQKRLDEPAVLATTEARNAMVAKAFIDAGLTKDSKGNKVRKNNINRLLDASIDAFAQDHQGRMPSGGEIQQMVDNAFIKGSYGGAGIFTMSKSYMFDVDIEDIPDKRRRAIEMDLRQRGVPVTEGNIITEYLAQDMGKPGSAENGSNSGGIRSVFDGESPDISGISPDKINLALSGDQ